MKTHEARAYLLSFPLMWRKGSEPLTPAPARSSWARSCDRTGRPIQLIPLMSRVFRQLAGAQDPVGVTTSFRKLIGVTSLFFVTGVSFGPSGLVLLVRPARRKPRCGRCGRRAPGYDRRRLCYWRHLALGRFRLWLAYAPRRVACPGCGVTTEEVPWASSVIRFPWEFEGVTAYLAEITDRTTVTKMMGIAWRTVGRIVERVIERRVDSSRLEGLRAIGVDEFSYRKRHHYLTVVVDHDRRRIVWAKEGRSCEVLKSFFQELGIDRCFNTKTVTIDMAAGYRKAIEEWLPQAEIVFDRFHVERLASEALEEVRRSIVSFR